MIAPDATVLQQFGVELAEWLGGRLNQHWLVTRGHQRLVLRRWWQPADSVAYELRLLEQVAAHGWPVAPAVAGPLEANGQYWTLAPYLPGTPAPTHDARNEQRARGRLLAEFHASLAQLPGLGQRSGWRRCEAILADPSIDTLLAAHQPQRPEEVRILRWHLGRARELVAELQPETWPGQAIHGDFTAWNLRFSDGRLSGILDFELAHWDHRVGDFALSWRGKYDAVIDGYNEVCQLEPYEWALITPLWWASLIEGACEYLRQGIQDDGWTIRKLLERSPLMGPEAIP